MKVALLTRDFPPLPGGVSTHVRGLLSGLRRLGVDVDVFVGWTDLGTLLLPLRKSLNEYDLVHVLSGPYGLFVSGRPMVVTVHAPIVDEWRHYSGASRYEAFPAYLSERVSLRRASVILAVSSATKTSLVQKYRMPESRVAIVGNGVDFERFRLTDEERVTNRILMVSRLEPRKNIPEALSAFSQLPHATYQVQVVGGGSRLDNLRSMAEKMGVNVTFLGRVSEAVIPRKYNGAAIFLTTSHSEGFGLSLLEAMASGCAVVASDIPTHRALVTDGESGLIYRTPGELAESLKRLLKDKELRERLALGGRDAASKFSWEKVAQRVAEAYGSALSKRKQRLTWR